MSGSTLPSTLNSKYVGTFGSLVALTGAVTAPVIGDTATLTDIVGVSGGVAGVTRKVFWSGIAWVVFDAKQHTSLNAATLITDASRVAIANVSPSADNLSGSTEYRSSQSVNFVVRNGIVQANVVPAGTYIAHGGAGTPTPQLFFATLTLFGADIIVYNTLNSTTAFSPLGVTVPIGARYSIIMNWWHTVGFTTTSAGFVYIGRGQNGVSGVGVGGQQNSIPVGTAFPTRTATAPYANVNSASFIFPMPAGTISNSVGYQNVSATYNYSGATSVGIREE